MILLLAGCAFAVAAGAGIGWSIRARRSCGTCLERAEAEAALEAIRREPETLERLKGMKVDPAAMKARTDAVQCALNEAGLRESFFVGRPGGDGLGWKPSEGKWCMFAYHGGEWSDEKACRHLPAFLAEAEKRLRVRNADLRRAGIDAP